MDSMVDGITELFGYNRGNFFFDRKLRQEREYQEQDMRIKQFMLYREDVRDLTELTVSRMDSYLLIALLELGCCLDMLVEGVIKGPKGWKPAEHHAQVRPPTWLVWLYVVSLSEAFLHLFLSVWFAIHASVSAHSFSVRLLTQYVRLPVPNKQQLDAARAYASDFECLGFQDMTRVPVLRQQCERLRQGMFQDGGDEAGDRQAVGGFDAAAAGLAELSGASANPTQTLEHVKIYRTLQANWQAHDAYSRACLCLGTYTLIHAFAYYLVGLLEDEFQAPWPALGSSIVLPFLVFLLSRLDLYFSSWRQAVGVVCMVTGPFLAYISDHYELEGIKINSHNYMHNLILAINFLMHFALIFFMVFVARGKDARPGDGTGGHQSVALPTRFRTVLYLDVFGWVRSPEAPLERPAGHGRGRRRSSCRAQQISNRGSVMLSRGLRSQSRLVETMLRSELLAWESPANQQNLRQMPDAAAEIRQLRGRFDGLARSFEALDRQAGEPGGSATEQADRRLTNMWLKLVWVDDVNDAQHRFYYRPDTGEARQEEPEDGALVSALEDVEERLDTLEEHLGSLLAAVQPGGQPPPPPNREEGAAGAAGAAGGAADGASTWRLPRSGRRDLGDLVDADTAVADAMQQGGAQSRWIGATQSFVATSFNATSSLFFPARAPAQAAEDNSHAQETRFGGREAVGRDQILLDSSANRPGRRPLGQVPWTTFLYSSIVLGFVWLAGVAYFVIKPLLDLLAGAWRSPTIRRQEGEALTAKATHLVAMPQHELLAPSTGRHRGSSTTQLPGATRVVLDKDWPPRPAPPRPVGLACRVPRAGDGTAVWGLLAERYAVYEVQFETTGNKGVPPEPPRLSSVVEGCLSRVSAFHAGGVAGVALDCPPAGRLGRCVALLLSAAGDRVLRCPLSEGGIGARAPLTPFLVAEAPRRAPALGTWEAPPRRWWLRLRPPPGDGASDKACLLRRRRLGRRSARLGSEGAVVNAQGNHTEGRAGLSVAPLAPRAPLRAGAPVPEAGEPAAVLRAKEPPLLDLSSDGRALRAWTAGAPLPDAAWQLPSGRTFAAACQAGGHVYAAASGGEVWRFDAPLALTP